MKNDDEAEKPPHHLRKRGRRKIYWFRFKPPGRDKEINRSLKTSDRKMAVSARNKIMSALLVSDAKKDIATMLLAEIIKSDHESRTLIEMTAPGYLPAVLGKKMFSEVIIEYLDNKIDIRKLKVGSVVNYRISLHHFLEIIGDKEVGAIAPTDIERFMTEAVHNRRCSDPSKAKPLSPRTIANRINDLGLFLEWALKRNYLTRNPMIAIDKPNYKKNSTKSPPFELVDNLCEIPKPSSSEISQITWDTFPYIMRYTGCRIGEAAQLMAKDVFEKDKILIMNMVAEKSDRRKDNSFPDGRKEVPVHPKLKERLEKAMAARPDGFLFPDVGLSHSRYKTKKDPKYGGRYRKAWFPLARKIWPQMRCHAWRSYVSGYLTKVAGVPETISEDICGHARGTINRDYSGRAPLQQLYEAVCRLP